MDATDIIKLRDIHSTTDNLKIFGDNTMYFYDNWKQHNHLIWDDTNEIAYSIRTSTNQYNQSSHQLELISFPYSNIQYLISITDLKTLPEILNKIKTGGANITDEQILEILKELQPISRNSNIEPYGTLSQEANTKL
jgi:hypothetical protein